MRPALTRVDLSLAAVASLLAAAAFAPVREAVSIALKIVWLYVVTGSRG